MSRSSSTSTARDTYLNLLRVHEKLFGEFSALFREHGLTHAQFNVLRILLGAPAGGVPCQYISERLLNRVPDVTRLIDRMEAAELVRRERSTEDRRVVLVAATRKGKKLCEDLARPVMDLHRRQLAHVSPRKLEQLNKGLQEILSGS